MKPMVLVIDDSPSVANALKFGLEADYEVTVIHDSRAALRLLLSGVKFTTIICDLNMPGLDGLEFKRNLMVTDPCQASKIIFISGDPSLLEEENRRSKANHRFLSKPFTMAKLLAFVHKEVQTI